MALTDGEDEEQDFFARTRGAKVFEMDEDEKLAEDPVMNAALTARANHRVEKQMMELLCYTETQWFVSDTAAARRLREAGRATRMTCDRPMEN